MIAAVVVVIAGVTTSSVNAVNIVIIVGIALHGVVTGLTIFVVVVDVVVNVVNVVVVGCGVIAVVVDCLLNKSRNETFRYLLKPQLSSCQIFKEIPKIKRNDFEDFCFKSFQRRRKFLGLSWRRFSGFQKIFIHFFNFLWQTNLWRSGRDVVFICKSVTLKCGLKDLGSYPSLKKFFLKKINLLTCS